MDFSATLSGFGALLSDTSRVMRRRFEQKAQAHGLTSVQWRAVWQLSRADSLTQIGLANLLESDPMTISKLLERLESGGFVERFQDPSDKRAKLVRLTQKSRALLESMRGIAHDLYLEAVEGLADDEVRTVIRVLNLMNSNLANQVMTSKEEAA